MKTKKAYVCAIAWDHEIGETNVTVFTKGSKQYKQHKNCGVYEVQIKFVRQVEKPKPLSKNTGASKKEIEKQIKEWKSKLKKSAKKVK